MRSSFSKMPKTMRAALTFHARTMSSDPALNTSLEHKEKHVQRVSEKKQRDLLRADLKNCKFLADVAFFAKIASENGERWLRRMVAADLDVKERFVSIDKGIMCALYQAGDVHVFAWKAEGATGYRDNGTYNCLGCWCQGDTLYQVSGETPTEFLARCTSSLDSIWETLLAPGNVRREEEWCLEEKDLCEIGRRRNRCTAYYNEKLDRVELLCDQLADVFAADSQPEKTIDGFDV